MLFTGHYDHLIDAKNRLAIPADIRSQWKAEECGGAWYAMPWPGGIIRLFTEVVYKKEAAGYSGSLTPNKTLSKLQITLFGLSKRLETDAAGRIRIPEEHLALTGLPREVALVGAGSWLEIRDRAQWKASIKERLEQLPELLEALQQP